MPILIFVNFALALTCAVHALRTGRQMYWLFILFAFPVLGSIAYLIAELGPELAGGRTARAAQTAARRAVDPLREVRKTQHALDVSRTPKTLADAAQALLDAGRSEEAAALFGEARSNGFEDDPALGLGHARALYESGDASKALATLDVIRAANPDLRSPEAHLLYARTLEALGQLDAALKTYEAVAAYYPGAEARARWAMALEAAGQGAAAQARWSEILAGARIAPPHARRLQRDWIDLARARSSA